MKRVLIETGLAAMIFFAANAIYGVDALFASVLSGTDAVTEGKRAPVPVEKPDVPTAMLVPAPSSLQSGDANPALAGGERSVCKDADVGSDNPATPARCDPGDNVGDTAALMVDTELR